MRSGFKATLVATVSLLRTIDSPYVTVIYRLNCAARIARFYGPITIHPAGCYGMTSHRIWWTDWSNFSSKFRLNPISI